eukprot:9117569-Lingulodinium_polyedra.AAC.1
MLRSNTAGLVVQRGGLDELGVADTTVQVGPVVMMVDLDIEDAEVDLADHLSNHREKLRQLRVLLLGERLVQVQEVAETMLTFRGAPVGGNLLLDRLV